MNSESLIHSYKYPQVTEDTIYYNNINILCCYIEYDGYRGFRFGIMLRNNGETVRTGKQYKMNKNVIPFTNQTIHSYYYHHHQQHFSQYGMAGWTVRFGWNFYLFLALLVHWNRTIQYKTLRGQLNLVCPSNTFSFFFEGNCPFPTLFTFIWWQEVQPRTIIFIWQRGFYG